MMILPSTLMYYSLIGLLAGLLSGLFGIGGGLVIVPALVSFAGFSQHRATGTSLAALLLPVGLGAVFEYHRRGEVDWRAALIIAVVLMGSSWMTARVASRVSDVHLKMAFGGFLSLVGFSFILSAYFKSR